MWKSDEEIIADYIAGNEKAFDELVSRYLHSVYNLSYALVRTEAEAEDVVQETFVKIWKNMEKFKPGNNFKSWLLTITRNTAYDYLRKRKHIPFSSFEDDTGNRLTESLAGNEPTAEELIMTEEEKSLVTRVLKKISPAYREVLTLYYGEELTFDEIGKILKKPLNTVKSQHRRALIELRKHIGIGESHKK